MSLTVSFWRRQSIRSLGVTGSPKVTQNISESWYWEGDVGPVLMEIPTNHEEIFSLWRWPSTEREWFKQLVRSPSLEKFRTWLCVALVEQLSQVLLWAGGWRRGPQGSLTTYIWGWVFLSLFLCMLKWPLHCNKNTSPAARIFPFPSLWGCGNTMSVHSILRILIVHRTLQNYSCHLFFYC